MVAARQLGEGDGRIDVIERRGPARDFLHEAADRDAIGHIRPDDHRICLRELRREAGEVVDIGIEAQPAVIRIGAVALTGVPGHIAFQEQDVVAARRERLQQRTERRGMAVAPRRRQ